MCVIVHQPKGSYLSQNTAKIMWERNPDGAGWAFINDDNEFSTGKAMSFGQFWRGFEQARSKNRDKDFLVHFRIATSGRIHIENTHPFEVDEHTLMAHNGMLNNIVGYIDKAAEFSDTRVFVRDILPELPKNWLDNKTLVDMVEDYIGGSKLMFLTKNPDLEKSVYILNKDQGKDVRKMWWSNDYYTKRVETSRSPQAKYSYSWGSQLPYSKENPPEIDAVQGGKPQVEAKTSEPQTYEEWAERNPSRLVPSEDRKVDRKVEERTHEEIEAWWLGADNLAAEGELLHLTELKLLRRESGLERELIYAEGTYICILCLDDVDMTNGMCACPDLLCVDCGNMAPTCKHDPEDAVLYTMYDAMEYYADKSFYSKGTNETEAPF